MDNQQRNNNSRFTKNDISNMLELYKFGKSQQEIGKIYNCSNGTVRYYLIKNNIVLRNLKESKFRDRKQKLIIIDNFLHENLIGWLLGDGGLRLPKRAANSYFTYTDKKEDHINYVKSILNNYNIDCNIILNRKANCFQLQSESLSQFNTYYNLFYGYKGLNENNQKRKILPNIVLTPIILKNWYIGDGSSSKQQESLNHSGSISCKYKNEFILQQLENMFNVKCYAYDTYKGKCYIYYFSNKALVKLLEYIGECPVENYKYKWIVRRSTTIIEPEKSEGIV